MLIVAAAVVGGVILLKGDKKSSTASATNHTYGQGTSGVAVVEYGDFQCPGCGSFYTIVEKVKEKYKDQITFQFVNFPLSTIHQNAQAAHRAAEAASNQGKFWEMYGLLYQNQNVWSSSTNVLPIFESYASQLGLDNTKFKTDYASAATNSIIQADIQKGQQLKITGTPTFVIDGKIVQDNNSIASIDSFSKLIDEAITAKTGQKPATTNETSNNSN